MNNQFIDWDTLPEMLSKEQFYKLCHISKKTALYLLRSGKVPSINSGKKTRCYTIGKQHVRQYLETRERSPETYSTPVGWYCAGGKQIVGEMPPKLLGDMQMFFTDKLSVFESDVLTTAEISEFTGYERRTVNRWCRMNKLKCFGSSVKRVPKVFLVEFLNSLAFRAISVKSEKHIALLKEFMALQTEITEEDSSDDSAI